MIQREEKEELEELADRVSCLLGKTVENMVTSPLIRIRSKTPSYLLIVLVLSCISTLIWRGNLKLVKRDKEVKR